MESMLIEGEKLIEQNRAALKSNEKKLDSVDDSFSLFEKMIKDIPFTEKSNLNRQLKQVQDKKAAFIQEFENKIKDRDSNRVQLENYTTKIQAYLNRLEDKQESLRTMKIIAEEDNELNTNFENEIKDLKTRLQQKEVENIIFQENIQKSSKEIYDKNSHYLRLISEEEALCNKLNLLQNEIKRKTLEIDEKNLQIKEINGNARNRSISPVRSPRRALDRSGLKEPQIVYTPVLINRKVVSRNFADDNSYYLFAIIVALIVLIIAMSLFKYFGHDKIKLN